MLGKLWANAVEIVGTVAPSNFEETVMLERARVATSVYYGVNNVLETGNSRGAGPDPSNVVLRDDDPRPNGKVYDCDAPGIHTSRPTRLWGQLAANA